MRPKIPINLVFETRQDQLVDSRSRQLRKLPCWRLFVRKIEITPNNYVKFCPADTLQKYERGMLTVTEI
jgi:hypothetical protein